MPKTPRIGTVRLLQLTKNMSKEDAKEIVTYIGQLEVSEDNMYRQLVYIRNYMNSFLGDSP